MNDDRVLRVVAKQLIPFILLFALYVQFHGDYGPGGGFQAGVIFASGFILYALVFGLDTARAVAQRVWLRAIIAGGVLLYSGVGAITLLLLDGDAIAETMIKFGIGVTRRPVQLLDIDPEFFRFELPKELF